MATVECPEGSVGKSQGSVLYLTFLAVAAALGGLLFGFDIVVISGTITPLKSQFAMSSGMEGWFVSSALLACGVGAAIAGTLSDRLGRKPVLILSATLFVIGSLGCAVASTLRWLIWARLIGGVGVGLASMVSPLYISEVSSPRLRGRMVSLFQFAITIGILLALLSNAGLQQISAASKGSPSHGLFHWMIVEQVWRGMFAMELFPSLLFLIMCLALPETPRWLTKAGRSADARVILTRVGGNAVAEKEMAEIRESLSQQSGSIAQLFQPGLRKALFVATFLAVASELSGITIVFFYGPGILERAGFSFGRALNGFVSIGLVNVAFTIVALWLIDVAGRRLLLFVGNAGALIALVLTGYLLSINRTSGIWLSRAE